MGQSWMPRNSAATESKGVVESGGNVAAFNHGATTQNSGNNVDASSSNTATQGNTQSNDLGQTQTVDRGSCCEHTCQPECEPRPCRPTPCDSGSPARELLLM